ncbi:MAG: LysM peptidoglycan-binding domain-containing protein [Caldilineaceae bacterium]
MHEATCTHCGRSVPITPDAPRCSHCGQDLHDLIPPDYAASYFYRRSADLASRGDLPSALSEVERGLAFQEASELRLLAAILSKRLGDAETMRAHIAAIPVDDRLRQEAEWLIRAQPASRSNTRLERTRPAGESRVQNPSETHGDGLPVPLRQPTSRPATERLTPIAQAIADSAAEPPPPVSGRPDGVWTQRIWSAVAVTLMLIVGAMGWLLLSGGPDALIALIPGLAPVEQEAVVGAPLAAITPAPSAGVILPTPTPAGGIATPLPTIPGDLVMQPTPAPIAAAAAQGLQGAAFNLASVLITVGRTDLAALDLRAELNDTTVKVSGVLTNTADRAELIALLAGVGSVQEVNAVDLLVRVPATYTVQIGDSVWSIVNRFYGEDPYRIAALLERNAAQLPNAEALQVGMVLALPE